MSSLQVEERIEVRAPRETVWAFLLDPEKIVTCLPGAGLDEVIDRRNFRGNIKVKVGPVTVAYKGKATLTEVDDAAHKVTLMGEGREKAGTGTVKMTMNSQLHELSPGVTQVEVRADLGLTGKVVRFGRGMMQGVSKEVFVQFGDRLRAALEPAVSEDSAETASVLAAPTPHASTEPQAINGLALLLRAVRSMVQRLFSKWFRRST